ncbi:hypothetical protein LJC08_00170 [Methanimicrococcus sp. OttesenSCG-928-J09]|nr:hypothetical protein [Methanimicrococcus sp. OttesenSCG-928-J09]
MASPLFAALLSFFVPGLGQFYCGRFLRGIFVFIAFGITSTVAVSIATLLVWTLIIPVIMGIFCLLIWLWNILDAYSLAKRTVTY